MSNREPPQELLRWCDVKAWQPKITFYLMRKWRAQKVVTTVNVTTDSVPYYRKSELKRVLGLE